MSVTQQTPYNAYVGNGVTTVFPYTFKILAAGDLRVYVDGSLKTLNVDYTVSGAGVDAGGSVTMISGAPASTLRVMILRSRRRERLTDYQAQGDFETPVVNPDFDNPILLLQDLAAQLGRAVAAPEYEPDALMTLPAKAVRASKFLACNANGDIEPAASLGVTALSRSVIGTFLWPRTTAEIANGVTPSDYAVPPGYQARYSSLADLIACGERDLYLAANTTTVIVASLAIRSGTRLIGPASAVIRLGANVSALTLSGVSDVSLEGFTLDGNRSTYTTGTNNGIYLPATGTGCTDISMFGLHVKDFAGAGIIGLAQTGSHSARITVQRCRVENTGAHGIIFQDYVDDTTIVENYVKDFGMVVSDRPGITTGRSANRHKVNRNTVIGSSSAVGTSVHGISLDNCIQFECSNNLISSCIGYGIELGGAQYGTCANNTVLLGSRACIEVGSSTLLAKNIAITGNVLYGSSAEGILTQKGGGANVQNITISGNMIEACNIGISLQDTSSDITVLANVVRSCTLSGIYAFKTDQCVIVGNHLRGNNSAANASHAGIRIVNAVGETTIVVRSNQVQSSGIADYTIDNPIQDAGESFKPAAQSFPLASATPSVALGPKDRVFKTSDTTTYTDFTGERGDGDAFFLLALHAATVSNNANIKTSTGANKTLTVNVIYRFVNVSGVWYEQATV